MHKNSRLCYIYISLLGATCISIIIILITDQNYSKFEYPQDKYYKNHQWMFNVNVFQYSSYLIVKNSSHLRIEILTFVQNAQNKRLKGNYFSCHVKNKETLEVQRVPVIAVYRLVLDHIYKIVCLFDKERIKTEASFNNMVVAGVANDDFDMEFKWTNNFPLSMINYQRPKIIKEENPRLPKVGVCVNHISSVYSGIYNWVKMHEYFQATEIVMHDASQNKLRHLLYPKFKTTFVEIREYNIINICATYQIKMKEKWHAKNYNRYKKHCEKFQRNIFYDHGTHNHLSVNDCYSSLSYKYEFVTLYDLDELILPRAHNILDIVKTNESFQCTNLTHICSYKPIMNFYDYLKGLVKNEFNESITNLRSIAFHHSIYLFPEDFQTILFQNLKNIVCQIKSNSKNFPFSLNTGGKLGFYHSFTIDEKDKDYAIYLSEKYDEIACLFDKIIKKISCQISGNALCIFILITINDFQKAFIILKTFKHYLLTTPNILQMVLSY